MIKPVAQEGVIHSFVEGIHPDVDGYVGEMINLLAGVRTPGDAAAKLSAQFLSAFADRLAKRRADVERAVAFLPASDLGVLAGDLIRMTALRNRASLEPETVGGPIDVAVLSRHEPMRIVQQTWD